MSYLKAYLESRTHYKSFLRLEFSHTTSSVYDDLARAITSDPDQILVDEHGLVWTLKDKKLGEFKFPRAPYTTTPLEVLKMVLANDLVLQQYMQVTEDTPRRLRVTVLRDEPLQTKLILADLNKDLVEAWRAVFSSVEQVSIHHGSIFDVECDAIVSPANSFGFMDGGLDLRISEKFGWQVQLMLQQLIQAKYHGELVVGMADIVETQYAKIPYLIAAPTMRVPMILGPSTVNVYLAMRAILLLIKHGSFYAAPIQSLVQTVAIPGLGTGVGQVPYDICARQMKQAIDEVLFDKFEFPASWHEAQTRHQQLYSDSPRDLQYHPDTQT